MRYHFSRCNNQLFNRHVRRELVLFLNNDVIFPDAADALEMMIAEMRAKPELGGPRRPHYPDIDLPTAGVDMLDEGPSAAFAIIPKLRAAPPPRARRKLADDGGHRRLSVDAQRVIRRCRRFRRSLSH